MMSSYSKAVLMYVSTFTVFFLQNLSSDTTDSDKLKTLRMEFFVKKIQTLLDRKATYPWIGDPKGQHFVIELAERDSLAKWPLTSFQGSGVTWTRQLIEGVTGIYTGSVYNGDSSPVLSPGHENDNTDDPLCGCTIIDKYHETTITIFGLASYFELLHRQV